MKLKIVHVKDTNDGEVVLGTYPFGTELHEFVLGLNETILVRDENDRDYLVVAVA